MAFSPSPMLRSRGGWLRLLEAWLGSSDIQDRPRTVSLGPGGRLVPLNADCSGALP